MSELYELLESPLDTVDHSSKPQVTAYLNRLCSLSLTDLTSTEPASLLHATQSHLRNLQALSRRSHKAVLASSTHLSHLSSLVPAVSLHAKELNGGIPPLESAATKFAAKYDRSADNEVLDRRKRAMLLSRNVDRVTDVLGLPALLSSTIAAGQISTSTSSASTATSYASALDLNAHIRRVNLLYPQSSLVASISRQAEAEIANLTTILIATLQSPTLKLASAMRTISWLQRIAPELSGGRSSVSSSAPAVVSTKAWEDRADLASEQTALGSLFLVCRLRFLHKTLEALEPLRDLADQDTLRRQSTTIASRNSSSASSVGTQSERYVKRYIEVFREQSFNIISMYKSIFPSELPSADRGDEPHGAQSDQSTAGLSLPYPVASFAMHLVELLVSTLRDYLANVTDKSARESLLTQTLYAASSLGRLGADFSMMLALLEDDLYQLAGENLSADEDAEWLQIMKKHRVQATRLEVLARGVGTSGKKGPSDVSSPDAA